jgi:hypothetical protein
MTAAVLMTGIETKLHRHSPKRNDKQLPKNSNEAKRQLG